MSQSDAQRFMAWGSTGTLSPTPTAYSSNKTTDPEARDFEHAIALFWEGLRAARRGDLQTGRTKIAAAYLLDYRCSRWYMPVTLPEMQDCVLDMKLLTMLAGMGSGPDDVSNLNIQEDDLAPSILTLFLAMRSGAYQQNQELGAVALKVTQEAIDKIAKDPTSFENNPRVLDGCLTRAAIHNCRGDLYDILNNPKKAASEYKKAMLLEPENYKYRAEYAMIKYCYCSTDSETILCDCKTVIENIHSDNRRVRHMYAILAIYVLHFPALGTFDQALAYYAKMKQSHQRQLFLYSEQELYLQGTTSYCRDTNQAFDRLTPQDKVARRAADSHMSSGCALYQMQQQAHLKESGEVVKRLCMNCKKAPQDGVTLRKCSRCKQVSYCSKECQLADWKNHKGACRLHSEKKKQSA